jgi:hypothetical protein
MLAGITPLVGHGIVVPRRTPARQVKPKSARPCGRRRWTGARPVIERELGVAFVARERRGPKFGIGFGGDPDARRSTPLLRRRSAVTSSVTGGRMRARQPRRPRTVASDCGILGHGFVHAHCTGVRARQHERVQELHRGQTTARLRRGLPRKSLRGADTPGGPNSGAGGSTVEHFCPVGRTLGQRDGCSENQQRRVRRCRRQDAPHRCRQERKFLY